MFLLLDIDFTNPARCLKMGAMDKNGIFVKLKDFLFAEV